MNKFLNALLLNVDGDADGVDKPEGFHYVVVFGGIGFLLGRVI